MTFASCYARHAMRAMLRVSRARDGGERVRGTTHADRTPIARAEHTFDTRARHAKNGSYLT